MFENLSEKLQTIFTKLKGRGLLRQEDVNAALKEIRMALLEADVNFKVVKDFIEELRLAAVGQEVLDSITPAQQIVKIVYDRLMKLIGGAGTHIKFGSRVPAAIMLIGLQGCGKTTTAVKLARLLTREQKKVYLVSADIYRPAAMEQLAQLGKQVNVGVFADSNLKDPVAICAGAMEKAKNEGYDVLIIDTAGRLHIDEILMEEIKKIKEKINPAEILYIADAMTGQDAVNIGKIFNDIINIDGVIMTKMDGDARGGAALSLKAVIGKPIKYIGMGEKTDALEVFHPERIASRILGMGDILTLVEKVKASIDEKEALQLQKRIRKNEFSLYDFRNQLEQIKKMGPFSDILAMIPGLGKVQALKNEKLDDQELIKIMAIIDSMTPQERFNYRMIDGRRRKRIALGSGTLVQDVNKLLKNYEETKKYMAEISQKGSLKSIMRNFRF